MFGKFKEFVASMERLTGARVITLCSDNGGEYKSSEFKAYLKEKGIGHRTSTLYSPSTNGLADRHNRILMESARNLLVTSGLDHFY